MDKMSFYKVLRQRNAAPTATNVAVELNYCSSGNLASCLSLLPVPSQSTSSLLPVPFQFDPL